MNKRAQSFGKSMGKVFSFIIAFVLGGVGLGILYNYGQDISSIVGGFALIGIAIAIIYKIIENE